jgi:uncharacterized membrane protein YjgN (DUF898 family)
VNTDSPKSRLELAFTASGSEYFRIWVVNLLLIIVTLGLFLPFAKARRLRYFYANTLIEQQPLAFHGDPWKMLRGYLLMLVLFGGYAVSGYVSPWAALGVFLLLALLWPALWRSSIRFRLHNTSWRGLRFGFAGSTVDAYKAMLPLFLPGLIFVAANTWFLGDIDDEDPYAMKEALAAQVPWILLGFVLMAGLFPLCLQMIKRYQHQGYRYADQQGQFSAGVGAFFKLGAKFIGLSLLGFVCLGVTVALAVPLLGAMSRDAGMGASVLIGLLFAVLYVGLLSLLGAYFTARVQNLSWNATRSQALSFGSSLSVMSLAALIMKNLLLMIVTLGLYRPFAVVNVMALRLGAVEIEVEGNIDAWRASAALSTEVTSGEMAGDFFGIDMGL